MFTKGQNFGRENLNYAESSLKHKPKPNYSISHFSPGAGSFATRLWRVDSIFFLHSLFSSYRSSSLVDAAFLLLHLGVSVISTVEASDNWLL